jgi:hypothetical protein
MTGAGANPMIRKPLFSRRTLVALVVLTAAFVTTLHLLGRPGWCKYGIGVWANAWTQCTSQHLLDPYSLTHVSHGLVFFLLVWPLARWVSLRWRVALALAIEIGWEVLENTPWVIARYRQGTAALDYTGDTILNAVGDLAMTLIGVFIAARFSWKVSLALFVMLELAALALARDNLLLNILMLLYPLEAVKDWQIPPDVATLNSSRHVSRLHWQILPLVIYLGSTFKIAWSKEEFSDAYSQCQSD